MFTYSDPPIFMWIVSSCISISSSAIPIHNIKIYFYSSCVTLINTFEKKLSDYIIRKLKKTSRLCNLESNPESNYSSEKVSRLCNPEVNYKFKK